MAAALVLTTMCEERTADPASSPCASQSARSLHREKEGTVHLVEFQVRKFRSIVDSGVVAVDQAVTCLVGKNEAGKSALLEALYLLNPVYGDSFDVDDQYPRWLTSQDRRKGDINRTVVVEASFDLDDADLETIEERVGPDVFVGRRFSVGRRYSGDTVWGIRSSEANAVRNVIGEFHESIPPLLGRVETATDLHVKLGELAPSEDGAGGPTVEQLDAAQALVKARGLEADEQNVWRAIAEVLEPRLPSFFRFTEYQTMPGRVPLRDLTGETDSKRGPGSSGIRAIQALLKLAEADLSRIGDDDYELRRGELESVQIDLTNQVFEYWKQNPNLEVSIDVDKETVDGQRGQTAVARYLDIRLRDRRTGYSNNFGQRSSGFQWFFSFLAAFSEFEQSQDEMVVLLDEPALTLHGKAQADFLRFINERLAPSSPVLYTTHSPFMVEADKVERVRLVEDRGPDEGSVVSDDVLVSDPDSLFPLQAALGYDIAQSLFVGPHNFVVEGTSEYIYLNEMSRQLGADGRTTLDDRWRLLPAGGATNIPTFVALIGPHLDATVLTDSDTRGMQRVNGMIERGLLQAHRLIRVDDALDDGVSNADIEDLFTVGDYLKLYNSTFNANLKAADLPPGDRVTKRIEKHTGERYDHGRVAEHLLRDTKSRKFSEATLSNFEALNALVNATMES
jgi:predicted ATPase